MVMRPSRREPGPGGPAHSHANRAPDPPLTPEERAIVISHLQKDLIYAKQVLEITSDEHGKQVPRDLISRVEKALPHLKKGKPISELGTWEPEPANVTPRPITPEERIFGLRKTLNYTKQVLEGTSDETSRQSLRGIIAKMEAALADLDTGKDREG